MLSREAFVAICHQAIIETRRVLAIANQESGYKLYHRAIKQGYFEELRNLISYAQDKFPSSLFTEQYLLQQGRMGVCYEFAAYLAAELLLNLNALKVDARVRLVKSVTHDHGYLHLRLQLAAEDYRSLWEVDAWHPRIIEVSQLPNGKVKNADYQAYGTKVKLEKAYSVLDFTIYKQACDWKIKPPTPGSPELDSTPPHDYAQKHPDIYSNYTIEAAYISGELPQPDGTLSALQRK